jgi:hypothetical protein
MANPATVAVGTTWTLVASNVRSGRIKVNSNEGSMKFTYRETGGTAPTGNTDSGNEDMMENREYLKISNPTPIDVYMVNTRTTVNVTVWL